MFYQSFIKPFLFRQDPEAAHDFVMNLGRKMNNKDWLVNFITKFLNTDAYSKPVTFKNLTLRNPVGLAAGFDKNGYIPNIIYALGFGFTEIGSITAQGSAGNPRPRMFRLPDDEALINRMGLNNNGAKEITTRLKGLNFPFPVGINISKTHSPEIAGKAAVDDYVQSFMLAEPVADYITINISCPNTKEGKTFEELSALDELLTAIDAQRSNYDKTVLIKISSDVNQDEIPDICKLANRYNMDGFVATNTSLNRKGLSTPQKALDSFGNGGLSGAPILERTLRITEQLRKHSGDDSFIISVGGINSLEKMSACLAIGADAIQVYTALVYNGPFWVHQCIKKIHQR